MFENFVHKTGEWFLQLDSMKNFKFHTFIKRAQDKRPHANQRKLKIGHEGHDFFLWEKLFMLLRHDC